MGDALIPVELGLSAFVAKLIEETFDAIICSNYEQAKKQEEILLNLQKNPEAFAREYVTDAEIFEYLGRVFASGELKVGAPYKGELEAKLNALGILLSADKKEISENQITAQGMLSIRQNIRQQMANERFSMLSKIAAQGMPRVVVDAGQISAKVAFYTNKVETKTVQAQPSQAASSATPAVVVAAAPVPGKIQDAIKAQKSGELQEFNTGRSLAVILKRGEFLKSQPASVLPNINISVRQAAETASTSSAGMVGEVVIKFKTV